VRAAAVGVALLKSKRPELLKTSAWPRRRVCPKAHRTGTAMCPPAARKVATVCSSGPITAPGWLGTGTSARRAAGETGSWYQSAAALAAEELKSPRTPAARRPSIARKAG
jgi:hypothetical protein